MRPRRTTTPELRVDEGALIDWAWLAPATSPADDPRWPRLAVDADGETRTLALPASSSFAFPIPVPQGAAVALTVVGGDQPSWLEILEQLRALGYLQ